MDLFSEPKTDGAGKDGDAASQAGDPAVASPYVAPGVVSPLLDVMHRKIFSSNKYKAATIGLIWDFFGIRLRDVKYLSEHNSNDVRLVADIKRKVLASGSKSLTAEEERKLGGYTIVDMRCKAEDGSEYGIELQVEAQKYYAERAMYYAAFFYNEMYGDEFSRRIADNKYSSFYPIYALSILGRGFRLFPDSAIMHRFEHRDLYSGIPLSLHAPIVLGFFELGKEEEFPAEIGAQRAGNLKCWKQFFLTGTVASGAPSYINAAYEAVKYAEASKEEREMISLHPTWSEREALIKQTGREEGIEEGMEKGMEKAAQNMLALGLGREIICQATGLSMDMLSSIENI
jgi:predicted transposase/invertase (TIGR01784 family)